MIYIAGPFFNEEQLLLIQRIEKAFDSYDISYFSPRKFGVIKDMSKDDIAKNATKIFKSNIDNIDDCNIIVAVIDNFDPGTMFELGYAYAKNKKIYTLTDKEYGLNLMLSKSVDVHFDHVDQIPRAILGLSFKGLIPETVT